MRLSTKIIIGLSLAVLATLSVWGFFFYSTLMRAVNNDMNQTLTAYASDIIVDYLYGVEDAGDKVESYNSTLREVPKEYAEQNNEIKYWESNTYIASQNNEVPSRKRRCIFMDSQEKYYELTVSMPTFERDIVASHITKLIAILYFVILGTIIFISYSVLKHNLRPLEDLIQWFESYAREEKAGPMPVETKVVEFQRLSNVAKKAVDRLEEQSEEQRSFLGNMSHELQTPLSVCVGRIELLLDDPDLTEHQADELLKLRRSLMETVRLNRTLLTVYKVDNNQFPESEEINFKTLVEEALDLFSEIYGSKSVSVETDFEADFRFAMNPDLARSLVQNLLKNAYVHSAAGSKITVRMGSEGFAVANDGTKPLDEEKVFTRFYRQSSDKSGSTGLGLALVDSICRRYNLPLHYRWASSRHIFEVGK